MDTYWITVTGREYDKDEDSELVFIVEGNSLEELVADIKAKPRVAVMESIKDIRTEKV